MGSSPRRVTFSGSMAAWVVKAVPVSRWQSGVRVRLCYMDRGALVDFLTGAMAAVYIHRLDI